MTKRALTRAEKWSAALNWLGLWACLLGVLLLVVLFFVVP